MYSVGSSSALVEGLKQHGEEIIYKYDAPKRGLNVRRQPRILNPTNTQTFSTNNNDVIRFRLPNDSPLDFRRAYLLADFTLTTTPPPLPAIPYQRLAFGSWCWVDRLRYHSSNDTIEEIQNYNRIYSSLWTLASNPNYVDAVGPELMGTGSQAQREAATAGGITVRYCIPLCLGSWQTGVMPLHAFKNQYHELEIYLGPANTFVETNGTNPVLTISNLDLHVEDVCSWDGSYERSLTKCVDTGNFQVWFDSYISFLNNVINQQQDLVIAQRNESLNYIYTFFTDLMTVTDTTVPDKFITFPKTGAFSFQFKINTKLFPEEEVRCDGNALSAYELYLRLIQQWKLNGIPVWGMGWPKPSESVPNINVASFNADDFFMVGDFRNSPYLAVLNNISTEVNSMDLIFKVKLIGVPPPQTGAYHISNYNTVVNFLPSGKALVRN